MRWQIGVAAGEKVSGALAAKADGESTIAEAQYTGAAWTDECVGHHTNSLLACFSPYVRQ
jgi:hypothetical protein